MLFSVDVDKEEKKQKELKDKERQKQLDELIDAYQNAKKQNIYESDSSDGNKAEKPSFLSKKFVDNKYGDLFLKIVGLPSLLTVGFGCACWCAGFAVSELSKVASFLQGLSLSPKITNLIGTASFWKFVGIVAAICAVVFIFTSVVQLVNDKLKAQSISESKQHVYDKGYEKSNQKIHSCSYVENDKELYNAKIVRRNKYNNSYYNGAKKKFLSKNRINIYDRNRQSNMNKNKKKFYKDTKFIHKNYNNYIENKNKAEYKKNYF